MWAIELNSHIVSKGRARSAVQPVDGYNVFYTLHTMEISMKSILATILTFLICQAATAGDHTPEKIINLLKGANITLAEGIALAEKSGAVATSAKFEINNSGKLELSVYTIPEGLQIEPEQATLTELFGEVGQSPFKFKEKIFTDKEHIARSAVHMTMLQLSKLSLQGVLKVAIAKRGGKPIDVRNPMVRNGVPVADVVMSLPNGSSTTITVNLVTGKILGQN